ncbi:MAG: hypothetical protein AAF772_07440 [Acidobacteriota bacterium]
MNDRDRDFPGLRRLADDAKRKRRARPRRGAAQWVSPVSVRLIESKRAPRRCVDCGCALENQRLVLCVESDPYCLPCALDVCDAAHDALLDLVLQHGADARTALDVPVVGPTPWIAPAVALRDHLLDALLERLSSFVPQPLEAWRDGR